MEERMTTTMNRNLCVCGHNADEHGDYSGCVDDMDYEGDTKCGHDACGCDYYQEDEDED